MASTDDYTESTATTGRVAVGGSITGKIGAAYDQDWFKVNLLAGTPYIIDLEGLATGKGTLYDPEFRGVYNSTGTLLASTSDGDSGTGFNAHVIFTPTRTGDYYLSAGAYSTYQGTYTLSVTPKYAVGNEDTEIPISLANLQAQNATTDSVKFIVKSVNSGTLKIGTSAATATPWSSTNKTVDAKHQAYWTPAPDNNGLLNAFTAVGKDSSGVASSPLQAQVAVTPVIDVKFSAGADTAEGSTAGGFTVTLDQAAPAGGLAVNYIPTGFATLNIDYTVSAGTNITAVTGNSFTIAAGQTTATLNVTALTDTVSDPNETVMLHLMPGTGYDVAAPFLPKVDVGTGSGPASVTVGDFNGDGKLDLAATNWLDNTVSVLLRNAANTGFDPKVDIATGSYPNSVSVGDLNGDGKLDLAVANVDGNTVSVLLRNAANTGFDPKINVKTGTNPYSLSVGDFNGDGKLDLATANFVSNTVSVLLRNASNTGFDPKIDLATDSSPYSLSVGDMNGDGQLDLAVANSYSNTVSVLLRNAANSGFDPKIDLATGSGPSSVSVGDLNGDGKLDLAVANSSSNTVSVLLRNAANTGFDPKVDIATGSYPLSLSVGDLNDDGKLDLVTANYYSNTVSILLRNAANTGFDPKVDLATGYYPYSLSVGDLNGDGKLDLAAANYAVNTVSVLLNDSHSSLTLTDAVAVNHSPVLSDTQAVLAAGTENTAYTINTGDLLQGFSDADGDSLAIADLSADHGTVNGLIFTPDANYTGIVTLTYNVTDGKGGSVAAAQNFVLAALNHLPTGDVSISDTTPTQGQILTASNTLADADNVSGIGAIAYQWQAAGVNVGTGLAYTVTAADVGKTMTVTAGYTDDLGHAESVSSAATAAVAANLPTTAGFTISPLAQQSTGEDGTTAVYSIRLNTAPLPNRDVTLSFTSSDTTEGVIDKPTLTFTSANYATPQTLTVRGVDDYLNDSNIPYQVLATVSTIDVFYKALSISPFSLTNLDDGKDTALDLYGDEGGSKIDVLVGGNGADKLHGLNMADDLSGGLGNDSLWGGYGDDVLWGEDGDDSLEGEQENDLMVGGAGNDFLYGTGGGLDTMRGGAGNDTYYLDFDAVKDVIDDQGLPTDIDTVIMPFQLSSYTLPTGIENGAIAEGLQASNLTGNEGDNALTGNDGSNALVGAVGRDSLFGGAGNDVLSGGVGNDALSGGIGRDLFTFNSALSANIDRITDFVAADDTVQLENSIFTKLSKTGVLNSGLFVKAVAPHDANDYLIYNPATGALSYDADGNGTGASVQIAVLGVNLPLTYADFVVI